MATVCAAVIQMFHGLETTAFLGRADALVREAAADGARLVAFPETVLPGYPAWLDVCRDVAMWDSPAVKSVFRRMYEASVRVPGPETEALARLAHEAGVTLVIGVTERVEAGPGVRTLFNTLLTFGPNGALRNHHRKLVPTYTERLVWGPGDHEGVRAVDTPVGRVGGLVCWEHWMPLARQAMHESAEHVHVAAWPQVKELNLVASRHYAFEGRCFVLAAGGLLRGRDLPAELEPHPELVPSPDAWILRGGSCIIGPDGQLMTEPVYEQEAVIIATLDLGRIPEESMALDTTGHYHRPDCFRLHRVESTGRGRPD